MEFSIFFLRRIRSIRPFVENRTFISKPLTLNSLLDNQRCPKGQQWDQSVEILRKLAEQLLGGQQALLKMNEFSRVSVPVARTTYDVFLLIFVTIAQHLDF